jgi:DNA-binding CsgD family transcriptional regulator
MTLNSESSTHVKIVTGIFIFLMLSAVGFTFQGKEITWFWNKLPFIAIALAILSLLAFKALMQIEKTRYEHKIRLILQTADRKKDIMDNEMIQSLSIREKEVFRKILEGKNNKQIAGELFVELSTVKTHINNIYKILKVRNRPEAINLMQQGTHKGMD